MLVLMTLTCSKNITNAFFFFKLSCDLLRLIAARKENSGPGLKQTAEQEVHLSSRCGSYTNNHVHTSVVTHLC